MIEDLLRKKIIRDYLSLFSESKWKTLIPLTIEHGILNLKRKTNITTLSLDDISLLNETIKAKFEKGNVMEKESPQNERMIQTETSNMGRSKSKETRPSSKWRKGDDNVFKKKEINVRKNESESNSLNSEIYPKWWGTKKHKYNINSYKSENINITPERKNQIQTETKHVGEETKNDKVSKKKEKKDHPNNRDLKHKENKKSTNDVNVKKNEKPLRNELKEIESKIKNDVERDKKIYNKLKQQNSKVAIMNREPEYTFPRKKMENTESSNLKTILTSDYKIEYDKSLKPQAIREKSIERKVPAYHVPRKQSSFNEDRVDFIKKEPITKVSNNNINYNTDKENIMSETEGGLSSYAPSERTKNFFSQFRENSADKSSLLSNSLNYSSDKFNTYENNKTENSQIKKHRNSQEKMVSFNNYINNNK